MLITPKLSPPSQAIEVVVTETGREEERALEKEMVFLPSPVADGLRKEPIHRLQAVSLKRRSLFTPSHVRRDSPANG